MRALSIPKFEEGIINEDASKATSKWIAVSDGAGGGGVFADKWSNYLVQHIPSEPIQDYAAFDDWLNNIWEPFYNDCECIAKQEGGMLLNKFYDEGSFATIVVVWKDGRWISYGDSVAFCYDKKTGCLQHSFGRIVDFNNPPYLVNCKDPTNEKGFKAGAFQLNENCVVFAASDALAHYILMMYEVANKEQFEDDLTEAISAQTKDSNFINTALSLKKADFSKVVLGKLMNCRTNWNFRLHLISLHNKGLLGYDDYSFTVF